MPKVSALSPIAVTTEDYTNSSESATKFRSLEVATTSIKVFSDTTKNTLSFKNNVTVTSTIKCQQFLTLQNQSRLKWKLRMVKRH